MNAEAIEEASNGLEAIVKNVKSLLDNPEGIAELSSKPAKNFMPAIGIYAKLLTKHGLDNMKDFDKMCQNQASEFGCEDAVEAMHLTFAQNLSFLAIFQNKRVLKCCRNDTLLPKNTKLWLFSVKYGELHKM